MAMRGRVLILVTLALAALIINLDTTIVNVALPSLVRQIGATTTGLQWVVDAYNLVFTALVLAAGSLSDRLGRKGMLLAGLAVFGASSLAGSFATSAGQLIAARAVMGLGDDVPVHALAADQRVHRTTGAGGGDRRVGGQRRGGDRAGPDRRRLAA
jgi:MFS family permease